MLGDSAPYSIPALVPGVDMTSYLQVACSERSYENGAR